MSTDTTLPLLYSYRRCPYAMRARLAMLQANRSFQTFEIVMRDKPAELLALSDLCHILYNTNEFLYVD